MMQDIKSIAKNHSLMKNAWIAGVALIVLLTALAYLPALRGGFIWDDDDYVTQNQTLRDVNGLKQIWFEPGATSQYYPLVYSTFWLEFHLWELNPLGYHVVNVLLHTLAAILLWRVLVRLQVFGAGLAAGIFALHPVCVESVAWITERKNVLSAVFYFAAALAWLRFSQNSAGRNKNVESKDRKSATKPLDISNTSASGPWLWYLFALGLFVAALLSKTVTCSLPAALLLVCWWKKGRLCTGDISPLIPFFVIGVVLGLHTALMEKQHVGASGPEWTLSFFERCLIAGRALWFYAGKLVWPANLAFIYPRWAIHTTDGWQWLFPIAALVVVIALWFFRHRIGRGPLVSVLFFAGTLFPALGFLNVYPMRYSFVADHFQYLASVGLIALAAAGLDRWCSGFGEHPDSPVGRGIVLQLLPLALGVITFQQTQIYHNLETLWRDTVVKNPSSWLVQNNLGVTLWNEGEIPEAIEHYEQALRIDPANAETHNNLGVALRQMGKRKEAIEQYEQTLRLNPDFFEAHCNLAGILIELDGIPEAAEHYNEAVRIRPDSADAHYNLGVALERLGRKSEAILQYEQALRYKPYFAEAHNNLALDLWQAGQVKQAVTHWELALRIKPDYPEAQNSLAWLLATLGPAEGGNPTRAVTLAQHTCELTGNRDANCLDTLAVAYAAAGRFNEAVATTQTAIELARSGGQMEFLQKMEAKLELYRGGHAYHPALSQ